MAITIGATTNIRTPFSLVIGTKEIKRGVRTANGTWRQDITAVKKTFNLSWNALSGTDYDNIVTALALGNFDFKFDEGSTSRDYTCFVSSELSARYARKNPHEYYDVTLGLEQV